MGSTATFAYPYPEPTDSVDVVRDVKALADRDEALHAQLVAADAALANADAALKPPWTTYAARWISGSVDVNLGSGGVLQAKWRRVGSLVDVWIKSYVGTGYSSVAGGMQWTLPYAAADYWPVHGWVTAPGLAQPTQPQVLGGVIAAGQAHIEQVVMGTGNMLSGTFPFPSGSMILLRVSYETSAALLFDDLDHAEVQPS